jgi:hypothetical protein
MTPMDPMELLDAGLKATLVLGLAGIAALSLRRGSAASRHLVWTLGVAAALLLPSLRAMAPRWELPLLPGGLFSSRGASPAEGARPLAPATAPNATDAASRPGPLRSAPIPSFPPRRSATKAPSHSPPPCPPGLRSPPPPCW